MRPIFGRRELRLEQCRDEEARAGEFDGAEFAVVIECGELESAGGEIAQISPVHFVVAEVFFFGFEPSVDLG